MSDEWSNSRATYGFEIEILILERDSEMQQMIL